MPISPLTIIMFIVMAFVAFQMVRSGKKQKERAQSVENWRENLKKGDEVATFSGLIGTVETVELDKDQIVINSEGSLSRWRIQAITEPPIVPAYIPDEDDSEEDSSTESEEQAALTVHPEENAEVSQIEGSEESDTDITQEDKTQQ